MVTLFAIKAAMDHPDRIPALFMLSVPPLPWVRLSTAVTAIKIAFGKLDSPAAQAMRGETALELTPQLWKYLGWAPRMIELLRECSRVRKLLPELTVPAAGESVTAPEAALGSFRLLSSLLADSEAALCLRDAAPSETGWLISFDYQTGGVPIRFSSGKASV